MSTAEASAGHIAIEQLDFSGVLDPALAEYVPRPTLEQKILDWMDRETSGVLLAVGEAGSGKTALAAHMITSQGYIHHFLRLGHDEFSLWRDPHVFLTSIALQMRREFGEGIFPEAVAIDVSGRFEVVEESGRFTGIKVRRLITQPWRSERFRVDFAASKLAGKATGVDIDEVVTDHRGVSPLAFRAMALDEPLRRLRRLRPDAAVVLWVDGLDEEVLAHAAAGGPERIADLLPLGSELGSFGNAYLVISTRPGPHIQRFEDDGAEVLRLDDPDLAAENTGLIEAIAATNLANDNVAATLAGSDYTTDELVSRSEGNPLFARQFFTALRGGHAETVLAGGVPHGLEQIQTRLLGRLAAGRSRDDEDARAVLAILTVAFAALDADRISWFSGLEPKRVSAALDRLAPLLDLVSGSGFRLYHSSLRQVLGSPDHSGQQWSVDTEAAHAAIGMHYFPEGEPRHPNDPYGIRYATTHLASAGEEERTWLVHLMTGQRRQRLRERTGSNRAFLDELRLVHGAIQAFPDADRILGACRLGLMAAYVQDATVNVAPHTLELMTRLGETQAAIDSLPEGETGVSASRRCQAILRGLAAAGFGDDAVLARQMLERSLERLEDPNVGDWLHTEVNAILDICEPGVFPTDPELLTRVFKTIAGHPGSGDKIVTAIVKLASLWVPIDADGADHYFRAAHDFSTQLDDPDLTALHREWFAFDSEAARAALGGTLQVEADQQLDAENDRDALAGDELAAAWDELAAAGHETRYAVDDLVRAQLEADAELLGPLAEAVSDRKRRAAAYRAATSQVAGHDPDRARAYLRRLRIEEEFPRESGFARHFYLALANEAHAHEFDEVAALLEEMGVHPTAATGWRWRMLNTMWVVDLERATELFESALARWGTDDINRNFGDDFPAALWGWPVEWKQQAAEACSGLQGSTQRRLLAAALARWYHRADPDRVTAFLESALGAGVEAREQRGMGESELLAFVAGQLWAVDHDRADEVWTRAVGGESTAQMPARYFALLCAKVLKGSPKAALTQLLAFPDPDAGAVGQDTMFPHEGVSEYRIAGMRPFDHVAGQALGAVAASDAKLMEAAAEKLPPAAQSFARCMAISQSGDGGVATKLQWCAQALAMADQVPQRHVVPLLRADVALAYQRLGADQKALDLARLIANDSLARLDIEATMGQFGYGYAVGRCLEVLVREGEMDEAFDLLWRAYVLRPAAYYQMLSVLPRALSPVGHFDTETWRWVEEGAYLVYDRG